MYIKECLLVTVFVYLIISSTFSYFSISRDWNENSFVILKSDILTFEMSNEKKNWYETVYCMTI